MIFAANLSETFLILRRTQLDIIINVHMSSSVAVIFVRFSRKVDFLDRFSKKYSNIKFYKNPSSGSRVILYGQTNRQTDITKLMDAFRSFAYMPKMRRTLTLRRLMSYIYGAPILDVSRSHTTTQHSR